MTRKGGLKIVGHKLQVKTRPARLACLPAYILYSNPSNTLTICDKFSLHVRSISLKRLKKSCLHGFQCHFIGITNGFMIWI